MTPPLPPRDRAGQVDPGHIKKEIERCLSDNLTDNVDLFQIWLCQICSIDILAGEGGAHYISPHLLPRYYAPTLAVNTVTVGGPGCPDSNTCRIRTPYFPPSTRSAMVTVSVASAV